MKKHLKNTGDALGDKTFNFAIRMVYLFKFLKEEKKEFIISQQLLRAGTNPGAMVREAINAETGKDFRSSQNKVEHWVNIF